MGVPDQVDGDMVSVRSLEMVMQVTVASPLDTVSRAEMVMRRFEAAIRIGVLSTGDRLPPESVLAEHLGVSPLTLRHGLYMLRDKGLVTTRRGRGGGSFVSGHVVALDADIDDRLRKTETDDLRDLFDIASSTSRAAARFSALRADEQDVRRLRSRNERFLSESDGAGLRRADGRFHIGLGVSAQSRQIISLLVRIQADLAPISWPTTQMTYRKRAAYEEHEAIISAIAAGDPAEAESLVSAHYEVEQILAVERHLHLLMNEARES